MGTVKEIRSNGQEESHYRSLIEQTSDTICIADSSLRFIEVNPSGCRMLGYSKEEVLQLFLADVLFEEDLITNPLQIDEIRAGKLVTNERRIKRKDGTGIEVELSGKLMEEGRLMFFGRDITQRKKAEKELQDAYLEKNNILESITEAFFAVDETWTVTYWNKEAEKILNTPKKEIVGQCLWEVFPDSIDSPSYKNYHKAIETGHVIHFEEFYLKTNRWYEISAFPSNTGLAVYFKDITERKKAAEELKRAYDEKNMVLECIDDGFFAVDSNSIVTYWNKRAEILLNAKKEDVIGKNLHEMFVGPNSMGFYNNYQKAIRENATLRFEEFSVRSNKWFAVSAFASANGMSVYFKDVTGRKVAEEKLKESELRYRSLVEQATDAICIADSFMRIIEINTRGCQLLGYSKEEFLNLSIGDIFLAEDLKANPFKLEELLTGKVVSNERRFKRKDGTLIEGEISAKMLDDGRFVIFARDITERKQAELRLQESNERFNMVSKATSDMVWDWDLATGKVYRNPEGWKKIFGTEPPDTDEGTKEQWDNRVHPEDRYKVQMVSNAVHHSEKDFFEVECRVLRDDGKYLYIHDRGNIIRNAEGKPIRLIGATQDITERKEAELQVAKSELRFRSLVQNGSDLTNILNEKGYYLYSSPAAVRILGYKPEELVGKNSFGFIHPDDIDAIKERLSTKDDGKFRELSPFRFKNSKGEWIWLESKITDMTDNPEIKGYVFNSRDVTERKKTEDEVKKLSLIAKETVNAVIITDPEGRISWVNEAFTRITEYDFEEALGRKPGDLLQGEETNPGAVLFMRAELKKPEPFECDLINYSKSGRKYWIRIQCQPQFDEQGKLVHFFAMQTDITNEKQAEEILKVSEERYRYLFNHNPVNIFIWDTQTFRILQVNDTAIRSYGYLREEFLTKTIMDINPPEDHDEIKRFAEDASRQIEFTAEINCIHITSSGQKMHMNIHSHLIWFKERPVIMSLCANITDKVFLEEELENERRLKHQEITKAVITAQENERQQLGSELHDNIIQILAGSRLYLGMAAKELQLEHPYLMETDRLINVAVTEIRNLSHELIPPSLSESELIGALETIIKVTQQTSGITINLHATEVDEANLSDKLKLCIYRIVQEQFNNILKHASAKNVNVQLVQDNEKTLLRIIDDGVGFDTGKKSDGVGLMNIKTRASLFNGDVIIISSPGNGCELRVLFN